MANLMQTRSLLDNGAFDGAFGKIYSQDSLPVQRERYAGVLNDFEKLYETGDRDIGFYSAPGRTEVCGNHTDHNHGCVLAAAVSIDAIAAAAATDNGIVRVKSVGYRMDTVDCSALEPVPADRGQSVSIIRGILSRFKSLGYKIGGFDATTSSQVLSGSGLSSSAAFEVLIGTILNHLYNDGKISPVEIAKIAQYAENVHFGKPCGLMDQMACSVGSFVKIDFCDPSSPVISKVNFDMGSSGHSLCIVDTKGSHSDLTDEYAAVRLEMESVAAFFGKSVLREVDKDDFMKNISAVRARVGDRAVLRAMHFYQDNARVQAEADALDKGDFEAFKRLVIESGRSSYMYNQNVFACKKTDSQPVSLALCLSESILSGRGAWRVHGGGFAGTIQAFVPDDLLAEYTAAMKAVFGDDCCYILNIRQYGGIKAVPQNGA